MFRFKMRPWRVDGKFLHPPHDEGLSLVRFFWLFLFKWFYLVFVRFDACCKMWTWRLKCEKLQGSEMLLISKINTWLTHYEARLEETTGLCLFQWSGPTKGPGDMLICSIDNFAPYRSELNQCCSAYSLFLRSVNHLFSFLLALILSFICKHLKDFKHNLNSENTEIPLSNSFSFSFFQFLFKNVTLHEGEFRSAAGCFFVSFFL